MVTVADLERMPPEERDVLPPHIKWRYTLAARRRDAGMDGIAEADVRSVLEDMLAIVSDGFGMPPDCLIRAATDECMDIFAAVVHIARRDFRFPVAAIAHATGWPTEMLQHLPVSDETLTEVREWLFEEWERTPDSLVPPPGSGVLSLPGRIRVHELNDRALVHEVTRAAAARFRVDPDAITGWSRAREPSKARAVTMAVVKALRPQLTTKYLGKLFGRDHATIVYNLKKVGDDPDLLAAKQEVMKEILRGK